MPEKFLGDTKILVGPEKESEQNQEAKDPDKEVVLETLDVEEAEENEKTEQQIESARRRIKKLEKDNLRESGEENEKKFNDGAQDLTKKPEEKAGFIKRIGRRIGETIGSRVINSLRSKIEKREIKCSGIKSIDDLNGKPYILAANHVKPENRLAQSLGMAPDAFLLQRAIAEKNQGKLNIIANPGSRTSKIPILKQIERFWSPLREAAMEGMGFIPVRRKKGSFNKNFIKLVEEAIKRNEPILIFPERHWYKEFDSDHEFSEGAAFIAKKYGLSIVPAYINGARSWSKEKTEIDIGQPIITEEKSREDITEEIRKGIGSLKDNADKIRR